MSSWRDASTESIPSSSILASRRPCPRPVHRRRRHPLRERLSTWRPNSFVVPRYPSNGPVRPRRPALPVRHRRDSLQKRRLLRAFARHHDGGRNRRPDRPQSPRAQGLQLRGSARARARSGRTVREHTGSGRRALAFCRGRGPHPVAARSCRSVRERRGLRVFAIGTPRGAIALGSPRGRRVLLAPVALLAPPASSPLMGVRRWVTLSRRPLPPPSP